MIKRTGKVYKITNLLDGMVYIGKTNQHDPERRWRKGSTGKTLASYRSCPRLAEALLRDGWVNFSAEVIATIPETGKELSILEATFIKQFDCIWPKGYNLKKYDSCYKEEHSQETKDKIRAAHLGVPKNFPAWNRKEIHMIDGVEHKLCPKCNTIKPFGEFNTRNATTQTGKPMLNKDTYCKICKCKYQTRYPYKRKTETEVQESYKKRGKKQSKVMKDHFTEEKKREKSMSYGGYRSTNVRTGEVKDWACGHDLKKAGFKLPNISDACKNGGTSQMHTWKKL